MTMAAAEAAAEAEAQVEAVVAVAAAVAAVAAVAEARLLTRRPSLPQERAESALAAAWLAALPSHAAECDVVPFCDSSMAAQRQRLVRIQ